MLTAFGAYCGIGSMLIGARQAGFKVLGNIEERKVFEKENFLHNFPGSVWNPDRFPKDIDLVMGHPSCAKYSPLGKTANHLITKYRSMDDYHSDPGLFPKFIKVIKEVKPKFFVLENLPKSLFAFSIDSWIKGLGGSYDLTPEIVSNYHYGNVQKKKIRFFMIGVKRGIKFEFVPGEFENTKVVKDIIGDLPKKDIPKINHVHQKLDELCPIKFGPFTGRRTFKQIKEELKKLPCSTSLAYLNKNQEEKRKIGLKRFYWDRPAGTITGGCFEETYTKYHPISCEPLTIRELLRIQGAPDSFVLKTDPWRGTRNKHLQQVGKFIAVEFCRYISEQIKCCLLNKPFKSTGKRVFVPNQTTLDLINPARIACGKDPYENLY